MLGLLTIEPERRSRIGRDRDELDGPGFFLRPFTSFREMALTLAEGVEAFLGG